jgi:hypothetical protein
MRKSLQQPQGKAPSSKQRHSRWRTIIVSAACLSLVATSWITAQQPRRQTTRRVQPSERPARVAAPSGLTPDAPAKEYIYAGGKLVATEEPRFSDVPTGHPYYNDIDKIAELGVTLGCGPDGNGNPMYCVSANVTRAQMAAFIMRAKGEPNPPTPPQQRFADVLPSHPFYNHIDRMAVLNITLGCGGGNYCPEGNVTHEQMAAFMDRAYLGPDWQSLPPPNPPHPQSFCDIPSVPMHPFFNHIHSYATARQVWLGCDGTGTCAQGSGCTLPCFCPTQNVRRDQMARILVRNFNL